MDKFNAANSLFVDEDFEGAVELYTKAIEEDSTNAEFFAKRCAANMKLNNADGALEDAMKALEVDGNHVGALMKKGSLLFDKEEYKDAKDAFEAGLKVVPAGDQRQKTTFQTWIRKCDVELEDEVPASNEKENVVAENTPVQPPAPKPAEFPFKYDWYQTLTHVTFTVLAKNIQEHELMVNVSSQSLKIVIQQHVLDVDLFAMVVPEEIKQKHTPNKVELKLKKAADAQWPTLRATGSGLVGQVIAPPVATTSSALPTPYASTKKWDQIEKELEKEEEDPQGEEALNKLFKDIYKNASEDTRRAMVKSFQTSGGTVLSTNWDEVAKKDYEQEKVAPDGMEWKKWD